MEQALAADASRESQRRDNRASAWLGWNLAKWTIGTTGSTYKRVNCR